MITESQNMLSGKGPTGLINVMMGNVSFTLSFKVSTISCEEG